MPTKITLTLILFTLLFSACSPATDGTAPITSPSAPAAAPATATASPLPTATTEPTATPLPSPTPIPWTSQAIRLENAGQVVEVNRWGRGVAERSQYLNQGAGLVVLTSLGVYIYETEPARLVAFIPNTIDFSISPDEAWLATSHDGGDVKLWKVADGALAQTFQHPLGRYALPWNSDNPDEYIENMGVADVGAIEFSPGSAQLAVGYLDGTLDIWQIGQDAPAASIRNDIINTVPAYLRYSPDGKTLVTITGIKFLDIWVTQRLKVSGARISFWNVDDSSLIAYAKDPGFFAAPTFLADGKTLLTLSGGIVRIWDAQAGKETGHFGTNLEGLYSLEISADGSQAVISGPANGKTVQQVRSFPAGNLIEQTEIDPPVEDTRLKQFLFDQEHYTGLRGLAAIEEQELRAWAASYWLTLPSGLVEPVQLPEDAAAPYFYAQDQTILWCKDGVLHVRASDGATNTFEVPSQKRCSGAALSPQKTYAAVWGKNYLTLVNLQTGQPQDMLGLQRDMNTVAFSADENLLITGSLAPQWNTSEVVFWQTDPPRSLYFPQRLDDRDILEIIVSSDKSFVLTLGGRIRTWQVEDGNNLVSIDSYSYSIALSPDDKIIANGDYYGDIYLWSAADGSQLAMLPGDEQVIALEFTADGSGLVALSADGVIRLWGLP